MDLKAIEDRVRFLKICIAMVAIAISFRIASIQIFEDPRLARQAKRQFRSRVLIRPTRGIIVDRQGEPLVVNSTVRSLAANPLQIPKSEKRKLALLLAKSTGRKIQRIQKLLQSKRSFVWIKRHLTPKIEKRLRKNHLMNEQGELVSGLWSIRESRRVYPYGRLAGHVLGDVNIDLQGIEGIEYLYDEQLKGKVQAVDAMHDALGRPAFLDASMARSSEQGQAVSLTIDASLQFSAERELRKWVKKTQSVGGTVIALNADTGEVLAMANEPSFDPNQKRVPHFRRRNRAVTDGYEPGSPMKAVLLAGTLADGKTLNTLYWGGDGEVTIQRKRITEAAGKKHGWISAKKMIQVSSNVVAAKMALQMGKDRYSYWMRRFGLGQKTGISFPGEISGVLPSPKRMKDLRLATAGFGQGILATPMQIARAFGTFINGGWLVQPKLVIDSSAEPKNDRVPVLSPAVADQVVRALTSVVEEDGGTGTNARIPGYRIAGKSGTSQVVDPKTRRYSSKDYIPSFVGFAVGVQPRIVVFASLNRPKGNYYSSSTAVPLFRDVLESVVNRFHIPKNPGFEDRTRSALAKLKRERRNETKISDRIERSMARAVANDEMPDVRGLTLREAYRVLKGRGSAVRALGSGVVHRQIPKPGTKLSPALRIRLELTAP